MYQTTRRVEFNHVDAAGIVFYPRYFEMINSVVENYFLDHVGLSFHALHIEQKKGIPTAHIDISFSAPSALGDVLTFTLRVLKIGTSSVQFETLCDCEGERRLAVAHTLVYIDLETKKSQPWPEALRKKLEESQ